MSTPAIVTHDVFLAKQVILRLVRRYLADQASDHTVAIVLPEWMHPAVGNMTAWGIFGALVQAIEIGDHDHADALLYHLTHGQRRPAAPDDELLAVAHAAGVTRPTLTLLEG